jgi:hypothetical protein
MLNQPTNHTHVRYLRMSANWNVFCTDRMPHFSMPTSYTWLTGKWRTLMAEVSSQGSSQVCGNIKTQPYSCSAPSHLSRFHSGIWKISFALRKTVILFFFLVWLRHIPWTVWTWKRKLRQISFSSGGNNTKSHRSNSNEEEELTYIVNHTNRALKR